MYSLSAWVASGVGSVMNGGVCTPAFWRHIVPISTTVRSSGVVGLMTKVLRMIALREEAKSQSSVSVKGGGNGGEFRTSCYACCGWLMVGQNERVGGLVFPLGSGCKLSR